MLIAATAHGQHIVPPSMVSDSGALAQATVPSGAPMGGAPVASTPPAWDAFADPATSAAQAPYSPYAPSPYSPPPSSGPQPLFPNGFSSAPPPGSPPPTDMWGQLREPVRFLQEIRLRNAWLAPIGGANKLGVDDVETSATFAFPFLPNQAPFLVTPGFGIHFWDGPISTGPGSADLPPNTYDAYLDIGWQPQITPWFSAILGVRVGAYTDFNTFTTQSIREMGRGLGVFTLTPNLQLAVGVVYLDRNVVKILPAGGLIWTPNPDARYEILFPNPKLARRFGTIANADVWWYLAGEYGGGAWTIQRSAGFSDNFDYNDIRVYLGAEGYTQRGLKLFGEIGYVFNRELVYRSGQPPSFTPSETLMLRSGFAY